MIIFLYIRLPESDIISVWLKIIPLCGYNLTTPVVNNYGYILRVHMSIGLSSAGFLAFLLVFLEVLNHCFSIIEL